MKAGWCETAAAATYHLAVSSQPSQIILVCPCIQCLSKPLLSKRETSLWQALTLLIASIIMDRARRQYCVTICSHEIFWLQQPLLCKYVVIYLGLAQYCHPLMPQDKETVWWQYVGKLPADEQARKIRENSIPWLHSIHTSLTIHSYS